MRKTKESLAHPSQVGDSQIREAQEEEIEERMEAIGGETSTEGVGRGFDAEDIPESELEKKESTADGPLSGEFTDPPVKMRTGRGKRKKNQKAVQPANSRSNHPAAFSTKSI